jgi:hypothetical protein
VRVEEYPPTGGHQSDRGPGGPDEHPEGRVCGPCLQEQGTEGEAGAGIAQEGGSDGEGHPKDEPHTDPDRAGGALERRRGGGGRPPKERLAARRTAAGRVPEELRVPHQEEVPEREAAEHGLRRGTEHPPRGNGERKGRRRPDPLLRNGGDPREAVLQVPSFRPHGEGVQEQGAVLQVRERGPPEERVRGGGQEVPELHQGQEGANEPLRDGQEVPRTPEEDAAEGEQNREDLNGTGEYSHNARDKLVVFQVNLGKGWEATDLLQKTAEEQKADVVLIQESYCYMPTWVGWTKYGGGRTDKIATLVRTGRRSIELTQFTGPTTRTVVIEGARGDIAFFNVYVPPKDQLEGTLTVLEELLASRKGRPTIIAGDLNGRHPAFGGEGGRQGPADHRSSRSSQPGSRERSGLNPDVRNCQREELDRHYTFLGHDGGKLGSRRGRNAQRSQEYLFQPGHRRGGKRPTKGTKGTRHGTPHSCSCSRVAAVRGTWGGPSRTFSRIAASLQKG